MLAYFDTLPANFERTLKCLTETLTVLVLILSEHQTQTLLAIDIIKSRLLKRNSSYSQTHHLNNTKPSQPLQHIVYGKFNGNPKLHVAECAKV